MVFQESYSSAFFISTSLASSACSQAHSHHPPPVWGRGLLVSAEQLKDMCQIVTIFLEGVSRTLFYCYILVITFLA